MKRQNGFTLIELVVVIVILGILAVTAAPKFMNLQGDARHASLQGLKGALQGASGIVYGKAAIKGIESSTSGAVSTGIGTGTVKTVFGYPSADNSGIVAALASADEWTHFVSGSTATFTFKNYKEGSIPNDCFVKYSQPSKAGDVPTISIPVDACK
ncbi:MULTISPECIES: type II secretion system protein [unclassified Photobacterium]|uniref:type II secretion system protein n=1 Tax=unclassified Photobacterium TaxID=2628852 RepID=UPI001EDEF977|nr:MULTISPECIES: type II secretion system protein [unclassified Photobacterium]MCG3862838.1 type II secretion system protein [Photobacterium sp. Ph6]MCG3874297.1 type II secretion system protein [Photobacterium sp. Ph5]